jgi:poly(hydroxyalkanoate) depolymerase family esterase
MYDPFKRVRSTTRKRMRRASASALKHLFGAIRSSATPAKPKATKPAAKNATRAPKQPPKPRTGAGNSGQRLKIAGKSEAPLTSRTRTTIPRGASFGSGVHECAFGTRSYQLYIPTMAGKAANPLPLLVMLHGCGQTPRDFARGTGMNALAEEFEFRVLYPAQSRDAHFNRCWNWFKRDDQIRGAGEPALIASMTRQIIAEHAADPAKVFVAGISAGASAALILANAYPDIFAAVGAHSGLPVGAAHDAASAVTAMRGGAPGLRHTVKMPTISFHGDSDTVVNPRNGRFVAARALEPYPHLRKTEKSGHVPGGRKYVRTAHRVGKGRSYTEHWVIAGSGHAWSGGNGAGSYTDPTGPDASREMIRFFLRHRTTRKQRSTSPT